MAAQAEILPSTDSDFVSLVEYCIIKAKHTGIEFQVRSHVVEVCDAIEQCVTGTLPDGKRHLDINIPPRFGKTFLVESAIEWSIGYVPDSEFIYTSYTAARAKKSVSNIRTNMLSEWYQEMFPFAKLKYVGGKYGKEDHFYTSTGGCVYAAGSQGSIIGFGAGKRRLDFGGFFVVDDPLKAKEARSETGRKNAVEFMNETAKTRLNSKITPIIRIMQRLHPQDPVAWSIENEAEVWHRVSIPAQKEDGTAEWEEAKSAEELNTMKIVDPFTYWTQYQQQPINPSGTVIKKEWWCYYQDREEILKRCDFFLMFADTAMKEKDSADNSVFALWGFEGAKRAYLIDVLKDKWAFPDLVKAAKAFWNKYSDNTHGKATKCMFIEDKQSGISLIQTLRDEGIPVMEWLRSDYELESDDKVSGAKAASWLIYGEKVWIPDPDTVPGIPWFPSWMDEHTHFAEDMSHDKDDQVDTTIMATLTWKAMW